MLQKKNKFMKIMHQNEDPHKLRHKRTKDPRRNNWATESIRLGIANAHFLRESKFIKEVYPYYHNIINFLSDISLITICEDREVVI